MIRAASGSHLLLTGLVGLAVSFTAGAASGPPGACTSADPAIRIIEFDQRAITSASGTTALCEGSAVIADPRDPGRVIIADNETRQRLFVFDVNADTLEFVGAPDMPRKRRPRDIEALAVAADQILVVGSHSRNQRCKVKDKRFRLRGIALGSDAPKEISYFDNASRFAAAAGSEDACLAHLFPSPPPQSARQVCSALIQAEQHASPSACRTLNIEGAVATPSGRIWVGLRAPVLSSGEAVLLRLADPIDGLRFDRVARIDLGGWGVRELALDAGGERIWGIAGPELDARDAFRLWSVEIGALTGSAAPVAEVARQCLPTSSEGLVMLSDRALVIVDGEKGDDLRCGKNKPSGYYWLAR